MNNDKPSLQLPLGNSASRVPADAFMDAAVNTLLPRLKELKSPIDLRADESVADLLKIMFFEVQIGTLSEAQASQLVDILPEIVEELKRLECENFEGISDHIYSLYLGISQALEARQNRSEVEGCLTQSER